MGDMHRWLVSARSYVASCMGIRASIVRVSSEHLCILALKRKLSFDLVD